MSKRFGISFKVGVSTTKYEFYEESTQQLKIIEGIQKYNTSNLARIDLEIGSSFTKYS